ncbi:MAG TPA: DNA-binding protein WhiA, partial [Bacillota bacterium]
ADLAADCAGLMASVGLAAGVVPRRRGHAVYLKDGDHVVRFLTITGAHGAVLTYEDARIYREVRGQVNRLVNAETANLVKVIGAAVAQIRDIELIDREIGLEHLPPALREVARLRLAHRDLSLRDLGRQCSPPLTKSAVAHRMRRLQELARRLPGPGGRRSQRPRDPGART